MKKAIIAGGIFAVIVLGALAVAVASAQSSSPTATPGPSATTSPTAAPSTSTTDTIKQQFLQQLAGRLGVSVDTLQGDINDSEKALIDQAVTDGKLTQDQANDLKTRIDNGENVRLGQILGTQKHGVRAIVSDIVGEAAKVLGMQKTDVASGLKVGSSLADIANAHGISTSDFQTALLAQVKTDLDAKVTSGDITQSQADQAYSNFSNNIDKITSTTRFNLRARFGGLGGGLRGAFGGGNKQTPSTSASPSASS